MQTEDKTEVAFPDIFEKCYNFTEARDIQAMGIYPFFHPLQSAPGNEVVIEGKKCIMVGSNNYLGLVNHPKVKEAAAQAALKYGSGCTGSRFLNGTLDLHLELEERLAKFMQREACQVFSTGFQTNLGIISSIVAKGDTVILDRQDHACILDGARLSYGKIVKFAHNDVADLERMIGNVRNNSNGRGGILIVVDGVFSMEGDIMDLPGLVKVAKKFGARVVVDDAHSVGVLGDTGAGTAEHFGLVNDVDLTMGTFSKSFASLGGFVAGNRDVIDYIKHHARSLIFSASPTPGNAAAALASLDIIESEPERREHLWRNAHKMQREFRNLGFNIGHTATPIVPIVVGEDLEAFAFWKELFDNGVFANPVISPAVPPGQSMIRTSYTATHTDEQLDQVVEVMAKVGRAKGLIS